LRRFLHGLARRAAPSAPGLFPPEASVLPTLAAQQQLFVLESPDGMLVADAPHVPPFPRLAHDRGWRPLVWTEKEAAAKQFLTAEAAEKFAAGLLGTWRARPVSSDTTPQPAVG
jgi:hypothetical protein